jgi:polysaccharide deacetylase family protein (PEP-CTERM system associated)
VASILITVDVEDWFQVENLRSHFPPERWDSCELRVERNTHTVLDLLDRFKVRATFFVLGWIAHCCPGLVREIHARGHEVASHGYNHRLCSELSGPDLREDLYRSKALLQDIIGHPVHGYRSPSFSITKNLVDLLVELGYFYDSSYNNFSLHNRYGNLNGTWKQNPTGKLVSANGLLEIPVSNMTVFGKVLPWGGGGYFRLLPSALFRRGVKSILDKQDHYVFYCHPWEFDADQPRVTGMRSDLSFRHYVNIDKNSGKLQAFLSAFSSNQFLSCSDYLNTI